MVRKIKLWAACLIWVATVIAGLIYVPMLVVGAVTAGALIWAGITIIEFYIEGR